MPVSPSFRTFILDQLSRVAPRGRSRSMFGAVGIYAGELFFALIADDTLYLKVDESNRPDFEARGMGPFRPYGQAGEVMQYYRVPDDLVEDTEALRPWAEKAVRQMPRLVQDATIKCPHCGFEQQESMPIDACVHFYECTNCHTLLHPKPGECCVFCSYGSSKCPPKQREASTA